MDFALTDEQSGLVAAVGTLLERHAGPARAREVMAAGGYDAELMSALGSGGFLDLAAEGAGPLEAVLVTEAVAGAAGCVPVGARTIVAPAVLGASPPDVVALVAPGPETLVRFAAVAEVFLADRAVDAADAVVTPVASMFGYPLARVELGGGGEEIDGDALRRWWQVAIAAELVGTMDAALGMTALHLKERRQFGRALAANQALQHRLAELYLGVEGARWLARSAAASGAPGEAAAAAAAYASTVAELVTRETHQLSGAMGLTEEYDLFLWTMRLPTLRLELGGAGAHQAALTRARWGDKLEAPQPAAEGRT